MQMLALAALLSAVVAHSVDLELDVFSHQTYNAANCTNIRMPPRMCPRCHLRPHDSEGNFGRDYNKDIIDFETPECEEQMQEYVRLNPCDTLRARYFNEYKTSTFAYNRVAQFMYSMCEQCCDMVTVGSVPSEYRQRKENNTLHKPTRGNGPAHLHYDICKMFPNATRFIRPNWNTREGLPLLCPLAADWIFSPFGKGWGKNPDADGIPQRLQFAFVQMEKTFGCRNWRVWRDCVNLERSQGRV